MKNKKDTLILVGVILLKVTITSSISWDEIHCSKDADQVIPEGSVANIGRFPWLGVVQHSFRIGDKVRFAITAGVLIHPTHAIAPAEDIVKILKDQVQNNTKFILWYNATIKYAIEVTNYILHPDYEESNTLATIALLELVSHGESTYAENKAAVLPVCMPVSGAGTFTDLYAVKMTDENVVLQKEAYKMKYVNDKDCNEFYDKNHLNFAKMTPVSSLCAKSERRPAPCVWDGGVALITRQSWGFWKILGFSVRGAGCGAPARFLVIHDYLQWLDEVMMIEELPDDGGEMAPDEYAIGFRRLSPIKIIMYSVDKILPTELGQCERGKRGNVLYKDLTEISMTQDFGHGFFYVIVSQIAQFNCAVVEFMDATFRTNTAIWVEHYCHRELTGVTYGIRPSEYDKRQECFMYFKSAAFIKFRFYFSLTATLTMTLYGKEDLPKIVPNPFRQTQATDAWYPTDKKIKWETFEPYGLYTWFL